QGNAAFKSGDYPTAIGHYTSAIFADSKDPTFPLNRAATYLKLGKYVHADAERDCTTVLNLSPKNAKAYFRRGQARVGLEKFAEAQNGSAKLPQPATLISPTGTKVPLTLFAFTREWESAETNEERWYILTQIPPISLSSLFQTSLEPTLLVSMLTTFLHIIRVPGIPGNVKEDVRQYMLSLARVPRFSIVLMLMSRSEKVVAKQVWEDVGGGTWEGL
ncbi:TPR-like protein, partial [Neolentinus lepideus HHB14362 ss-1]